MLMLRSSETQLYFYSVYLIAENDAGTATRGVPGHTENLALA